MHARVYPGTPRFWLCIASLALQLKPLHLGMFSFYFILMLIILEWVRETLKTTPGSLLKVWHLNIVWLLYLSKLLTGFVQEHRKEKTLSFKIIWTFFFYNLNECIAFSRRKLECWANHNGSKGGLLKCMVPYNPVGNWCFKVVKILDEITYCLKATLKSDINRTAVDWDQVIIRSRLVKPFLSGFIGNWHHLIWLKIVITNLFSPIMPVCPWFMIW